MITLMLHVIIITILYYTQPLCYNIVENNIVVNNSIVHDKAFYIDISRLMSDK